MKFIKTFFLILFSLCLLILFTLVLLLKYPTQDPVIPESKFAPRQKHFLEAGAIKISVFPTGYSVAPEAFVHKKGKLWDLVHMEHAAILVEHPKGNFIIDVGLGSDIDGEIAKAPWLVKLMNYTKTGALKDQPKIKSLSDNLDFIILTHSHWDHVSGALDFPNIPVYMLPQEIEFAMQSKEGKALHVLAKHIVALKEQIKPISLKDAPYENFSQSLDWFGDGSVVLVSLMGHTPGSLGVFLNLAPDLRYLVIGDAVWSVDAKGQPQAKSLLGELSSDHDRHQARRTRKKIEHLIGHSNEITLVPNHDAKALNKLAPYQP